MQINQKWHNLQDEERYSNVIAKNNKIKIKTNLNNVYVYTRTVTNDIIDPYIWEVSKNGEPLMILSDPLDDQSPLIRSTFEIDAIDGLLRWFYANEEIPLEVTIN